MYVGKDTKNVLMYIMCMKIIYQEYFKIDNKNKSMEKWVKAISGSLMCKSKWPNFLKKLKLNISLENIN